MGLRLRELMKEKGVKSISELARDSKLTQASMSNIINEKSKPTLENLEKIASALKVSVRDLFEREGEELTALIDYKGDLYKATTIEELKKIISKIE